MENISLPFLGKGHKDETKLLQKRKPLDNVSTSGIRLCWTTLIACSHCKEYNARERIFPHKTQHCLLALIGWMENQESNFKNLVRLSVSRFWLRNVAQVHSEGFTWKKGGRGNDFPRYVKHTFVRPLLCVENEGFGCGDNDMHRENYVCSNHGKLRGSISVQSIRMQRKSNPRAAHYLYMYKFSSHWSFYLWDRSSVMLSESLFSAGIFHASSDTGLVACELHMISY